MPSRATGVFTCLVLATCVTWWLGSATHLAGARFEVAATLTILIAFGKILFIGSDFMELRAAPRLLRTVFSVWVFVVAAAAVGLVVI